MLEVVFNQSASISLMMAQRYGNGNYYMKGCVPGFMFYGDSKPSEKEMEKIKADSMRKEKEKLEKAVPLGGTKADIFCFDFLLHIGGIGDDFLEERSRVLKRFGHVEDGALEGCIKDRLQQLENFCQRVQGGEEVRIWYGHDAEEMCGVLWLCHEMYRRELPLDKINFVLLPADKLNAGEVDEAEWWQLTSLQILMTAEDLESHANQWAALKKANAPLRVVADGCVLSSTEDFYDEMIWQEIEKMGGKFRQPKLIGRLLDQKIGICDSWISCRLDCFLEKELLELVAVDHECSWNRILKRKG